MRYFRKTILIAATASAAFAGGASAQGMSLGEFEYRNSCVACHGETGMGDGPVAQYLLADNPPNITGLQKANGGVFPVQRVYEVIEGAIDVRTHGSREMPVWGMRYRQRTQGDMDFYPQDTEEYVRTRILALIEYLSTMQVD